MADLKTGWVLMDIKKLRKQLGMTQQELSERTGIPRTLISRYENGTNHPQTRNRALLEDALHVRENEDTPNVLTEEDVQQEEYQDEGKRINDFSSDIIQRLAAYYSRFSTIKNEIEKETEGKCELCGREIYTMISGYGRALLPFYVEKNNDRTTFSEKNMVYLCPNCWTRVNTQIDKRDQLRLQDIIEIHANPFVEVVLGIQNHDGGRRLRQELIHEKNMIFEQLCNTQPANTFIRSIPQTGTSAMVIYSVVAFLSNLEDPYRHQRNVLYISSAVDLMEQDIEKFRNTFRKYGLFRIGIYRPNQYSEDRVPSRDYNGVVFVTQSQMDEWITGKSGNTKGAEFLKSAIEKSFVVVMDGITAVSQNENSIQNRIIRYLSKTPHNLLGIWRGGPNSEQTVANGPNWTQIIPPYTTPEKIYTLSEVLPSIEAQWDYKKNISYSPDMFMSNSSKSVFWTCPNGHSYLSRINERTRNKTSGCPYCASKKVISGENDLGTLRPDILLEWDYEKNTDISPEKIALKSNRVVFWKCPNGHSYEMSIARRTMNSRVINQCPICRKK